MTRQGENRQSQQHLPGDLPVQHIVLPNKDWEDALHIPDTAIEARFAAHYHVRTWMFFGLLCAMVLAGEAILMYLSYNHTPEYPAYTVLVAGDILRRASDTFASLPSSPEKVKLLSELIAQVRQFDSAYKTAKNAGTFLWNVHFTASMVVVAITTLIAVGAVVNRHHPAVKSRGYYFIAQVYLGAVGGIAAYLAVLANGCLLFTPETIIPTNKVALIEMRNQTRYIMAGAGCVGIFFTCVFCSAFVQRARILYHIFDKRALEVQKTHFMTLGVFVFPISVLSSAGLVIWHFVCNTNYDVVWVFLSTLWLIVLLYFVPMLFYFVKTKKVNLRFSDFHLNVRGFGTFTTTLLALLMWCYVEPGTIIMSVGWVMVLRMCVIVHAVDSLVCQLCYVHLHTVYQSTLTTTDEGHPPPPPRPHAMVLGAPQQHERNTEEPVVVVEVAPVEAGLRNGYQGGSKKLPKNVEVLNPVANA